MISTVCLYHYTRFSNYSVPLNASGAMKAKKLSNLKRDYESGIAKRQKMYFVALPCEIHHSHKLIGSVRPLDEEVCSEKLNLYHMVLQTSNF